jgi:hypothetical protein
MQVISCLAEKLLAYHNKLWSMKLGYLFSLSLWLYLVYFWFYLSLRLSFFLSFFFPPLSNFLKKRQGCVRSLLRTLSITCLNPGMDPDCIDSDISWLSPGSPGYNLIWAQDRFHTCSLHFSWLIISLSNPSSPAYWKHRQINQPK